MTPTLPARNAGFAKFDFSDRLRGVRGSKSVSTAIQMSRCAISVHKNLCESAVRKRLSGRQAKLFESLLLGTGDTVAPLWCNDSSRRKIFHAIKRQLEAYAAQPDGELLLVTLLNDDWEISEHKPRLHLQRFRAKVSACMAILNLDGVAFAELDVLTNVPHSLGGCSIPLHVHIVGICSDLPEFQKRVESLSDSRRLRSRRGVPTVQFSRIRNTPADRAMIAFYVTKPLYRAKRISPARDGGLDRARSRSLTRGMALRALEVQSYLTFREMLISRGKTGWLWRSAMLAAIGGSATERTPRTPPASWTNRLWFTLWKSRGKARYTRFIAIR